MSTPNIKKSKVQKNVRNVYLKSELIFDHIILVLLFTVYTLLTTKYSINRGEVIRWILLAGIGFFALLDSMMHNLKIKIFHFPYIIIIILAALPSVRVWVNVPYGMYKFLSFIIMMVSLACFLGREKIHKKELEDFFFDYVLVLYGVMIVNLIFYLAHKGMIGERFGGIFQNVNSLSPIAIYTFISALYMQKKSKRKFIHIFFALVSMIMVLGTASRTGFVLISISILSAPFVFSENRGLKPTIIKIFTMAMIIFLGYTILSNFPIESFQRIKEQGLVRGDTWSWGAELFKQKPIFGFGYGMIGYYVSNPRATEYMWGVHNSYLGILVEMGIYGLILFGLFFFCSFKNIFKCFKYADKDECLFLKVGLLILFNLLINAISESFLLSVGSPISLSFWFTLFMLTSYADRILQS